MEDITVDVSSPIIIDDKTESKLTNNVILDNVNLLLSNNKQEFSVNATTLSSCGQTPNQSPMRPPPFAGSDQDISSPSKRMKKKPENLPSLNEVNMREENKLISTTALPASQITPRKVGRPRGRKNNSNSHHLIYSPQNNNRINMSPMAVYGNMPPPAINNGSANANR